jgi:hypothetical protein
MVKISGPDAKLEKFTFYDWKRKRYRCKYEFTPHRPPLYLKRDQLREIIGSFLLEQSSLKISVRRVLNREKC